MNRDSDHWAMASLLEARFGHEAVQEARKRAASASHQGERDVAAIWREVEQTLVGRDQEPA